MKQAKLNIEFVVIEKSAANDQSRKWHELYTRLFKEPKRADKQAQHENKRIYKTCGFFNSRQKAQIFFCTDFVPQSARTFMRAKPHWKLYNRLQQ